MRLRLRAGEPRVAGFADFDAIFAERIAEAAVFYAALQENIADADMRQIQRQAFAGMLWSKQFYYFDVRPWLGRRSSAAAATGEPQAWPQLRLGSLLAGDIMSMPDKWEYPWFAAWDLAFHCVTLSLIDPDFAKEQLVLLCEVRLMHPNGQLPAYEWAFGDVNPPVHAWAACACSRTIAIRTAAKPISISWSACSTSCC